MERIDLGPERNRLSTLPLWQAVSLCVGLALLALPLIVLPGVFAGHVRGAHPIPAPVDAAITGLVLSLCTFRALAPVLGIALTDVFIRWPARSTAWWAAVGVLIPGTITWATTVIGVGSLTGQHVGLWSTAGVLVGAIVLGSWPAVLEEFLMRGYLLGVIGRRWGWRAGIVVSASMFALLHHGHATGPWSLALYLATTGAAGGLFALVTISTENVWNAVALHAAWNTLFSADVLAIQETTEPAAAALVTIELTRRSLLIGGDVVGVPESPLAALVLLAVTGIVFAADRRGHE